MFDRKIHTGRILLGGLVLALAPSLSSAQEAASGAERTDDAAAARTQPAVTNLDQITITGSRIPRAQLEGPSPVTVIKADDIDTGGHRSVFDVLSNLSQNTGLVQGEDFGSTFTPAANFISLRGLGPNHSLVLVNGHRIADYPVAYNGSINAVDLTNIPSVMIDRIEILSGSASAVYGSDAIAGVVNIILKKRHEGVDLSLRIGTTERGGGDNQRVQLIGGVDRGALQGVYGVELSNREPLYYGSRPLTDSYSRYAAPGDVPAPIFAIRDPATRDYYALPGTGCDGISNLMGGSLRTTVNPDFGGAYCSSDHYYSDRTNQTKQQVATGYLSLNYAVDDATELYGDFSVGYSRIQNVVRGVSWALPNGAFWNEATGRLENWTRVLTPEETRGRTGTASVYHQRSASATLGIRGAFGDSSWRFESALNLANNASNQGRVRFLRGIDAFFLGPQTGTHVFEGSEFPAYDVDPARILTPLTPDQYRTLTSTSLEKDKAWTGDVSFNANGQLFELPGGAAGFAGVVEAGRQGYRNSPDARIGQGQFWNLSEAPVDSGQRNRYAAGFELNLPVFSWLTATGAARYDDYRYAGRSVGKGTYNVSLELRPVDTLLLRGTYATSFRAPDMNYLFAKGTTGYQPGNTDYYQCRLDGEDYPSCDVQYNMNFRSAGNLKLKPETGKSFTYGFVWSPSSRFDFSADYFRIEINDEVTDLDSDQILRAEADCRLGVGVDGSPTDPQSQICRDATARVVRNPADAPVNANQVTNLLLNPINAATERVRGFDFGSSVRWDTARLGKYQAHAALTRVLEHEYQQFAGDPVYDYLDDLERQSDWATKINADVNWTLGRWSATLGGTRYGRIPKNDYSGFRGDYTLLNGSVGFLFDDRTQLLLSVNNLRNTLPVDKSAGWPNYSIAWYNVYGRQLWLQVDHHFGPGKIGS